MKPIKQQSRIKRSNSHHCSKPHPKLSQRRCPKLSITPITAYFKRSVDRPRPFPGADRTTCYSPTRLSHSFCPSRSPNSHSPLPRRSPHRSPLPHRISPHRSPHRSPLPYRTSPHRSPHFRPLPSSPLFYRSSPHRPDGDFGSPHHYYSPRKCSPHSFRHERPSHTCRSPRQQSPPARSRSPHGTTPHRSTPHESCSPRRSTPKRSTPRRSTPHRSTTPGSMSKQPQLSPVSRSSTKKTRNLTPVKLSSNFEFDFIRIPPPLKKPSTVCKEMSTPPASRNSSPVAPLYSPISTPSTSDFKDDDLYAANKTPSMERLSSKQDDTEEVLPVAGGKLISNISNSVNETIVISSGSDQEDVHTLKKRKSKCSLETVDEDTFILIDSSSDSDCIVLSEKKKVCCIDLSDSIGLSTSGKAFDVEIVTVDKKKNSRNVPTTNPSQPSTCTEQHMGPLIYPATGLEVLPENTAQLELEVESLLWKRGVGYHVKVDHTEKVVLLSAAQNSVAENLLDTNCRFLSDKVYSLVEYLSTVTSSKNMPTGESLAKLVLIISETQSSSNRHQVCPTVKSISLCYLHQLLLLHPPGQHSLVDGQYRILLTTLVENSDSYSLWEFLDKLSIGPIYCLHLLSLFVDLFLADYWSTLKSDSCDQPLFLDVFWTNKEDRHVTTPIRNLLGSICELLDKFSSSEENVLKLDSLMTLLYLCSTQCEGLSQELLTVCKQLHPTKIIPLLGRLHSTSLYSQIVKGLPSFEEEIRTSSQIVNSMLSKCITQPSAGTEQVLSIKTEPTVECNHTLPNLDSKKKPLVDVHSTPKSSTVQATTKLTKNSELGFSEPHLVKTQPLDSQPSTKSVLPTTTASNTVSEAEGAGKRPAVPTSAKFKGANTFTVSKKSTSSSGCRVGHKVYKSSKVNGSAKVIVTSAKRSTSKPSAISCTLSTSSVVQRRNSQTTTSKTFGKTVHTKTFSKPPVPSRSHSSATGSKVVSKGATLLRNYSKNSINGNNFTISRKKVCENCKTGTCVRCVQQRVGVVKTK